ncbi:MAG: 50S ribosomal protein L11 methyltransferase [Oscillospiraceae bacterium]|nr:50S ribosomal protein L11 methyltransferase [Oscillospiraceae bacterium]
MDWLEITVNCAGEEDLDRLTARLSANGADQLIIEDEKDFQRFLAENHQYWDYVDEDLLRQMKGAARVRFYVPDSPDGRSLLAQYTDGLENYDIHSKVVRDEDWSTSWLQFYKPIPVGHRLQIVPEWERDVPVPAGRTPVLLDPGLAFGTGSHASTQLCLELLEQVVEPGDRILDLGCGSGILSLSALCLGGDSADAVDIDPKAVESARRNAELNRIGPDRYRVYAGDILTDPDLKELLDSFSPYRLILANIVADVIIDLAPLAAGWLDAGALFLCSGILRPRLPEVMSAVTRAGLTVRQQSERDDWCALLAENAGG